MRISNLLRPLALVSAAAVLAGCAGPNPRDPYEGYNRAMFKFNDKVDEVALKPAATAYQKVLPSFVQTGVSNFFGNIGDVMNAANNLLQGKPGDGMSDVMRVALNSTFGLLGVLDIASEAGLQKHNEDFGQTLGVWGVRSGPYLVLPVLGPSTVRDTAGLPVDIYADPWRQVSPDAARNWGSATRVVDKRASLLDATSMLEEAALDRYEFTRDGFMQRRESQVFDGGDNPRKQKASVDEELPAAADTAGATAPASGTPKAPAGEAAIMAQPAAQPSTSL